MEEALRKKIVIYSQDDRGHNGVKSIIDSMGGLKEFKRLLIGIGKSWF